MTRSPVALVCVLASAPIVPAPAQSMSIIASVDLAAPDSLAYDTGLGPSGGFTLTVTGCAGALGCRVTLENPGAASPVPLSIQWRLTLVTQTGGGTLGCVALSPLLAWQDLSAMPVTLLDTGAITEPGTGCVAGIEIRAMTLSYSQHQHTSPPTTYWRDVLFRTAEK